MIRSWITIVESLQDWDAGWVHYSDHPMMTVKPVAGHLDPAGIYFFPQSFKRTAIG